MGCHRAFIRGLGADPERILSAHFERAAAGLVQEVAAQARKYAPSPTYEEVVEVTELTAPRSGRQDISDARHGPFRKNVGYAGYPKSLYAQDWFDSSPERDVANLLEDDEDIAYWMRLQTGDLQIRWKALKEYNPDFVAVELDGDHWVVEVKMDKEMESEDVQGKRQAALRCANHVSSDSKVDVRWRYLLVSEADIKTAKGSWEAFKELGGNP